MEFEEGGLGLDDEVPFWGRVDGLFVDGFQCASVLMCQWGNGVMPKSSLRSDRLYIFSFRFAQRLFLFCRNPSQRFGLLLFILYFLLDQKVTKNQDSE